MGHNHTIDGSRMTSKIAVFLYISMLHEMNIQDRMCGLEILPHKGLFLVNYAKLATISKRPSRSMSNKPHLEFDNGCALPQKAG